MLIFVAIAIGAFVLVAGAFLFGHDVDHDMSHDFGHDADSGGGTVSIFSMKVVATMLMGFGAAGAIARLYNVGYLASSLIGVGFGIVLAAMMFGLLELIGRQQSSSISNAKNVIDSMGQVTVSIDADGVGEVGVSRGGQYLNYPARSKNGKAIPKGRQVKVVGATGANVTVEEIVNE